MVLWDLKQKTPDKTQYTALLKIPRQHNFASYVYPSDAEKSEKSSAPTNEHKKDATKKLFDESADWDEPEVTRDDPEVTPSKTTKAEKTKTVGLEPSEGFPGFEAPKVR